MRILHSLCLILLVTTSASAVLTVRDRVNYFPLLIPDDYHSFVHARLPEVSILTATETERAYLQLKETRVNTTAYSWQQIGVNFMLQHRYDRALQSFINAEEDIAHFYDNSLFKAWLLEQGGDPRRASNEWSRLLNKDNTTYGYGIRLAACQLKMRQVVGVEETLNLLQRRAPRDPIVPHLRGVRQFAIGDYDRANEYFIEALQKSDTDDVMPETYLAMSFLTLREDRYQETIGWLKRAVGRAPALKKIIYLNLPLYQELYGLPEFQDLADGFTDIPFQPEGLDREFLSKIDRAGMEYYRAKFNVPESLRVNLRLRIFPEETKYRTLDFKSRKPQAQQILKAEQEDKKDAGTGKSPDTK
ncbi:MAG: tetratricopeptide (TPR) repeat protein [Kiritimatiellia bacterium]|jgi:tetratricopeptide (TPR) repeat protein